MVFSSVTFLFFFLPLFLLCYFLTPTVAGKNITALIFSLVFYVWGGGVRALALLLVFIAGNKFAAQYIDRQSGRARTIAVGVVIAANLLTLGVFKYIGFLAGNLNLAIRPFGLALEVPVITLPLGISFFTFHCLSYVIDVYRRRFAANSSLTEVAVYIALFPQLIAGPIVRYKTVARQLSGRVHSLGRASVGARMFVIGLAWKVLIADQLAPIVETVFDRPVQPSMTEAWIGLLAYTLQIYFDFGGYSNMAIGLGLVLGFGLPRNFLLPYTALSITEFWRRWHISLSSWLRDYLYIPLGGNRHGPIRHYTNLWTVFVLCGLWHGASWSFVLWGIWHGSFLILERVGDSVAPPLRVSGAMLRWAYTLVVVMLGWVLFRAHDLPSAALIYKSLIGFNGIGTIGFDLHDVLTPISVIALLTGTALAILPRLIRARGGGAALPQLIDTTLVTGLLILAALTVASGTYSPFLYFRF